MYYCSRGRAFCDGIYLAMLGCIRQGISGSPRLALQLSFARYHIKSRMLVFNEVWPSGKFVDQAATQGASPERSIRAFGRLSVLAAGWAWESCKVVWSLLECCSYNL